MKPRETLRLCRLKLSRMRRETLPAPPADHTTHTCRNCGYEYEGRYCPQCSLPASWQPMTLKNLMMGFLDIWGMGNRPIFRSFEQLFTRPGYMIRDYLSGRHLRYFPPFKMLAVLTVLLALAVWIRGAEPQGGLWSPEWLARSGSDDELKRLMVAILEYFSDHTLYRLLLQNVFVVLAAWIVFRRRGLNLVETTFSQIYINCQMQLMAIVWVLVTGSIAQAGFLPYAIPSILALLLLYYDFRQLYGLPAWTTVWRLLLFLLLVTILYALAVVLFVVIGLVVYQLI